MIARLGPRCRAHRAARRAAPADASPATAPARARRAGPRAGARAHAAARRGRGRRRPRRPARGRPDARLAPAAGDPRHRPVDARDARLLRPGPLRPDPRRRPRLPQARRPAARPATRRRAPTSHEVREFFAPYGEWKGLAGEYLRIARRARPAAGQSCSSASRGSSPSPGRNSFVSTRSAVCRRLIRLLVEHPVGVGLPLGRVLVAERPLRRPRGRRPAASPSPPPPAARDRAPASAASSASIADLRRPGAASRGPRAVACMKRAHHRAEVLVEVAPRGRRTRARSTSARRARSMRWIAGSLLAPLRGRRPRSSRTRRASRRPSPTASPARG